MVVRARRTIDLFSLRRGRYQADPDRITDATRGLFVTSNSEILCDTGFQHMIKLIRLGGFCPMGRF